MKERTPIDDLIEVRDRLCDPEYDKKLLEGRAQIISDAEKKFEEVYGRVKTQSPDSIVITCNPDARSFFNTVLYGVDHADPTTESKTSITLFDMQTGKPVAFLDKPVQFSLKDDEVKPTSWFNPISATWEGKIHLTHSQLRKFNRQIQKPPKIRLPRKMKKRLKKNYLLWLVNAKHAPELLMWRLAHPEFDWYHMALANAGLSIEIPDTQKADVLMKMFGFSGND